MLKELQSHPSKGLSERQAQQRLQKFGANILASKAPLSWWKILVSQFEDFMVLVLLATVAVSLFLGEYLDATAILAIVLLNSLLGFSQEYRAEKSLLALGKLAASDCKVLRDGQRSIIDAKDLVPGDLILLEPGDRVPADARLLLAQGLNVDESNLTGESVPSNKDASFIGQDQTPLGDRKNMLFKSTLVTQGYAEAVVVTTGMDTVIGEIAHLLQEESTEQTPLQRHLDQLGKYLVLVCLALVAVVFVSGVKQGLAPYDMFMIGVTLAVAAIPEGLPAVVTIALSVGVQRMSKQNAIIRQLPAVETLGCATVICSDKTGTLTLNKMEVQRVWLPSSPQAMDATKGIKLSGTIRDGSFFTTAIGALCTRAESYSSTKFFGEPTEVALLRLAEQSGLKQKALKSKYPEVHSLPFDPQRKRMTVIVEDEREYLSLVKGAPDIVLVRCSHVLLGTKVVPINQVLRQGILKALESMADEALRVLATAYKPLGSTVPKQNKWEEDLIFTGLVGMIDPPRPEVPQAVRQARLGGVRTIMVTGDHKKTAQAIAKQIGLFQTGQEQVFTGSEWEALTPLEQQEQIKTTAVFARVAPIHKLSIIRALKESGEIVAMTGDGVNDAPAVKEAHIGISMGLQGTDVTKEASDMVLLDDNFETIINAVREGRGIYDNLRKFIRYLLACNVGEVLTMLIASLLRLPLPLVPMQILWMNLVTDGLPAIALGLNPTDGDLMLQSPRDPKQGVFGQGLLTSILLSGILISVSALLLFSFSLWYYPGELIRARTLAFTTLVLAQLIFSFQCRSEHKSIFQMSFFSNFYLVVAVVLSFGAQIFIMYNPLMATVFQTMPLTFDDWLLVIIFSQFPLVVDTMFGLVSRILRKRFAFLKL